ncbi:MAG: hypothetical protein L6246_04010 [Thermodesulfovibrionales bacterium]|nr:hypothetical protein [Thermodesulfovibrionales bacterium]
MEQTMNIDLRTALPVLLPSAIMWAEARASGVTQSGNQLNENEVSIARTVGVMRPELIRIALVDRLPLPEDPQLRAAALQTGLLGPSMVGLTLGYSVFICHGHDSIRLLSHEFRHVYQYERFGSIAGFLPVYLQQIVEVGYANASFEIDAMAHEIK